MLFDDLEVCYGCLFRFSKEGEVGRPEATSLGKHPPSHLDLESIPLVETEEDLEHPHTGVPTEGQGGPDQPLEVFVDGVVQGHEVDDEAFDLEVDALSGSPGADGHDSAAIRAPRSDDSRHHLSVGVQDGAIWVEGLDVVTSQGAPSPVRVWIEWL